MTDKFPEDAATNDGFFQQASHPPVQCDDQNSDVIVASRIQLFRNIAEYPFVGVSSEEQQSTVLETIGACIGRSPGLENLSIVDTEQLKEIERQFLLEFQSIMDLKIGRTKLAQPQPMFPAQQEEAQVMLETEISDVADVENFAGQRFADQNDAIENLATEDLDLDDLQSNSLSATNRNIADHILFEERLESSFLQRVENATSLENFDVEPLKRLRSELGEGAVEPLHDVSITVNEEDHLRLQLLTAGYPLGWMWQKISHIDDEFEQLLNYAFSAQWGYLSSSPANVGTGMRITVLLHLPALATLGRLDAAFTALMREGIVARGVYSDDAWGDFFRIGNQVTLGKSEAGLINLVRAVVPAIVDYERAARKSLFQQYGDEIASQTADACRALTLKVQRSDEELLALISAVRLGIAFGMVSQEQAVAVSSIFELTRLKRKLAVAVEKEHYASATKYRDQIRRLEQRHYGH